MSDAPTIALIAYDDLQLFEFACAIELLSAGPPDCDVPWYSLITLSADGRPVRLPHGATLGVCGDLGRLEEVDILVVPGWSGGAVPEALASAVAAAHARGCRAVSICTGAFVLAAAGLLSGRRATTHWRYVDRLCALDATITYDEAVLYIDGGDVITSAGAAAGIDMLLHMIRRDLGTAAANAAARGMVVAGHREGGQRQFVVRAVDDFGDDRLSRVLDYARANLAKDLDVAALAERAGMTRRTFFRRFQQRTGLTPHDWVLHERIAAARELLESTDVSIEQLAQATGFGAADRLRHHFRRIAGVSPSAYRRSFGCV